MLYEIFTAKEELRDEKTIRCFPLKYWCSRKKHMAFFRVSLPMVAYIFIVFLFIIGVLFVCWWEGRGDLVWLGTAIKLLLDWQWWSNMLSTPPTLNLKDHKVQLLPAKPLTTPILHLFLKIISQSEKIIAKASKCILNFLSTANKNLAWLINIGSIYAFCSSLQVASKKLGNQ